MIDTDPIPPSAEVQEWAKKQSDSNGERQRVMRWDVLWAILVCVVSLAAIAFGSFLATVGMIKAGYCP